MIPLSTRWKEDHDEPSSSPVSWTSHRIAGTGRQGEQSVVAVPPWLGWTSSLGAPMPGCYHLHGCTRLSRYQSQIERCALACRPWIAWPAAARSFCSRASLSRTAWPLALVRCFDWLTAPSEIGFRGSALKHPGNTLMCLSLDDNGQ
jgi:hypothetical protein